nr:peptidoglycan DD-metalloendopeptidase family protein [Anaerolineae bacterium]
MATPYDGKVFIWHWTGSAIGEATIDDVANTLKTYSPVTNGVFIKTSDAADWQGRYDTKASMEINGPSDIARWVNTLAPHGLEVHAWCVIKGINISGEISKIVQAAQVPGLRSMILDVEPYDGYWEGDPEDVVTLMSGVRNALGHDFHIGISIDPRRHWYNSIHPQSWRPYVNSVHPQCYWGEMGRTPEDILTETYVTWGTYGLPIYPVLQGYGVSSDSIREAQDIARSVRGATGLSYFRLGVIGPIEFAAINEEKVDTEVGPDSVWRRYGWEKVLAPGESGYMDGSHTGQPSSQAFSEFTSVRGHPIKWTATRADRDTVWALWRPNLPARGIYEVSVFIPGQHATSLVARYHIHGIAGVGTELLVRLNQARYYDQWVPLVVYEFEDVADGAQVNLTDLTGETGKEIAFSAVRWRQVLEEIQPGERIGFDSPVGTPEERLSDQIWPGTWFDATGYATLYTPSGQYHTGADLNNNQPTWDADKLAPVYSIANGVVTFSARGGASWGNLIIIRHDALPDGTVVWSRYGHVINMLVREGDRVERGQQISQIGNAEGAFPYHLHFDIVKTDILEQNPSHWPGSNLDEVFRHYAEPRQFIINNRSSR